jgi:MoxR-like ATPase
VLKFETKSDHKAQDLFYLYDALRHFHAVQMAQTCNQDTQNATDYFEYTALGKAIILANELEKVKKFLPSDFKHPGKPQRSVVLIDEIDKAPRDFPNDILNEVEHNHFRMPELGFDEKIRVTDKRFKPILILTSNSEKHLPAAFLRRCVYYNIPFPEKDLLSKIVEKRLGQTAKNSSEFLDDALDLFSDLRRQLREKPATAKLLNWLMTLHQMFKGHNRAEYHYPDDLARTLSTLVTNDDDQKMAKDIFDDWIDKKKSANQIVE